MSEELKPCPFCGATAETGVRVTQKGGSEDHVDFSVACTKCGTDKTVRLKIAKKCFFLDVEKAMDQVIKAWNTRA